MTDISEPIEETPADGDDEFKDNWRENITQGANPNKLIDPSGIAYEWIPSNPVKGVRAEIYYQDETGKAVLWDAEHYSQINPQITDGAGWFAWDVPEGLWQVRLTADGYESVQSEWLPVLPVQTDVNLRLTSRLSSRIEIAEIDGRTVFVKFTKHMQDASITAENLYLTDAAGNIILCEITAQKETDNDTEASMYFTLTAESALALVNSTLHLTTGAKSYAGTASAAESIRLRGKVTEGDITGDGIVSIADAVMLARYASEDSTLPEGITENISNPRISDVDHDGSITVTDVTALLKLIAGVGYVR